MLTVPVLCLLGPTAVGKSSFAIELAKKLPIDIISVDSAMVYTGLDIGTSKPSIELRQQVPHYLIDICSPWQTNYSVGDFLKDVKKVIVNTVANKRIPCLVGGTMWYFNCLQQGISVLPSGNTAIRAQLSNYAAIFGWSILHDWLSQVDLPAANKIHPRDTHRIQRALEIYLLSGKRLSQQSVQPFVIDKRYNFKWLNFTVIPASREWLHTQIKRRFLEMLDLGFIDEVYGLMQHSEFCASASAMRAVGYRQILNYLQGYDTRGIAIDKGIYATRQLAKRQFTWLKRWDCAQQLISDDSIQNSYTKWTATIVDSLTNL